MIDNSEFWFDEFGDNKEVISGSGNRSTYRNLLNKGNTISTSSVVIKKSEIMKIGGFCEDRNYVTAEDYNSWLRLAKNGARFAYLDRLLGAYRIHSTNTIKQEAIHEIALISILANHFENDA